MAIRSCCAHPVPTPNRTTANNISQDLLIQVRTASEGASYHNCHLLNPSALQITTIMEAL